MKLKIWNPYGLGIQHMKFEWNQKRKFFWQKGPPFAKKKFLSPILMKLKILNPYGLGISHMKFERNRRRKLFCPRPDFDGPDSPLNVDWRTFPQSMIKFGYFLIGNRCPNPFLTWGKIFWPIGKILVLGPFCPIFAHTDQKMVRASIFDNDSLFSFIMTQIFEKKIWFLYKKTIWLILAKLGQIWPLGG